MAVTKEAIREILSFCPNKEGERANPRIYIGQVDADTHLYFGTFSYGLRNIYREGEPKVSGQTTIQRVPALVSNKTVVPLAYAADIETIDEGKIEKVLGLLRFRTAPIPESAGVNQEDW